MEALEPEDLRVWEPDLVDELELHWDPVDAGDVRFEVTPLKNRECVVKPREN